MPSGKFHYYPVTKLNADVTSGTQKLHCYSDILRFDKIPFEILNSAFSMAELMLSYAHVYMLT